MKYVCNASYANYSGKKSYSCLWKLKNHCTKQACLYSYWCIFHADAKYGHNISQIRHFWNFMKKHWWSGVGGTSAYEELISCCCRWLHLWYQISRFGHPSMGHLHSVTRPAVFHIYKHFWIWVWTPWSILFWAVICIYIFLYLCPDMIWACY